jgi:hypothetical protein
MKSVVIYKNIKYIITDMTASPVGLYLIFYPSPLLSNRLLLIHLTSVNSFGHTGTLATLSSSTGYVPSSYHHYDVSIHTEGFIIILSPSAMVPNNHRYSAAQ